MHHPRGIFSAADRYQHYLAQNRNVTAGGMTRDEGVESVVKMDPTNPIVHGPPTPEGPAAGAAMPINPDCLPVEEDKLPPKEILSNETTWYTNRVLKFAGDINFYKNSTPSGYDGEVDYEKKDTFKSTKEEKKKDQVEINKKAKKLAKEAIHKNVDMEEIEKVEDKKEEKGIKWVCNKTVEAKEEAADLMSMRQAMEEVEQRE